MFVNCQLNSSCGQLILRKICKTDATRCQILRVNCTEFAFRWGSAPDHAEGAYSTPPDSLAVFKGSTYKGGHRRKGEGKERKGKGEGRAEDVEVYTVIELLLFLVFVLLFLPH